MTAFRGLLGVFNQFQRHGFFLIVGCCELVDILAKLGLDVLPVAFGLPLISVPVRFSFRNDSEP